MSFDTEWLLFSCFGLGLIREKSELPDDEELDILRSGGLGADAERMEFERFAAIGRATLELVPFVSFGWRRFEDDEGANSPPPSAWLWSMITFRPNTCSLSLVVEFDDELSSSRDSEFVSVQSLDRSDDVRSSKPVGGAISEIRCGCGLLSALPFCCCCCGCCWGWDSGGADFSWVEVGGYLTKAEEGDRGKVGLEFGFWGGQIAEPSMDDWSLVSENRSFSCCSASKNGL